MTMRTMGASLVVMLACAAARAADAPKLDVSKLTNQPDEWFTSEDGRRVVDSIVSWQNASGGWWKSYALGTTRPATVEDKPGIKGDDDSVWHRTSTIDNGATYSELRILARAFRVTKDDRFKAAFDRGYAFLLGMQYPHGGWPQRFPIEDNYGAHVTYNDDAMLNVMLLMREIAAGKSPDFAWLSDAQRGQAAAAMARGVECILDSQIVVDGKPTIWCQQHDAKTLQPANARAYELPSFCTSESAAIVQFLMDVPNPNDRVKRSIESAVAWFEGHKIVGLKYERLTQPDGSRDVRITRVPDAVTWARFYDLETGKPFFCDRDGVKKDSVDEISRERQIGYAWYNARPQKVLDRYAKWKAANGG